MEITSTAISTNRYAPSGASDINMYSVGASGQLTLGQLVLAVSIRTAAAYEAQSVIKMNATTANSTVVSDAANWLEKVAAGTADWTAARAFAIDTLGVDASALPANLDSYDRRMQAVTAMKGKIDPLVQKQQQQMIDLQTMVNRRDVAYSAASNVVRALGTSLSGNAANI